MSFKEFCHVEMRKRGWSFEKLRNKMSDLCLSAPENLDTTDIGLQKNVRCTFNNFPDIVLRAEQNGIIFNRPKNV